MKQSGIFKHLGNLILFLIIALLLVAPYLKAYDGVNDRFFLPNIGSIDIDGEYDNVEWQDANKFTSGSEGYPELEVYGQYYDNHLYLAFHIDDKIYSNLDMLSICIDPNNEGTGNAENILLRYNVFRYDDPMLSIQDNSINTWLNNDNSERRSCFFSLVFPNSSETYWEIEVEIDCNSLDINTSNFGLYFQVADFVDPIKFLPHIWPTSAVVDTDDANYTPPAIEWGNACFVNEYTETRPDIYFEKDELAIWTAHPDGDKIVHGELNTAYSRVKNRFFPGSTSDGDIGVSLKLQHAIDWGVIDVNEFSLIGEKTISSIPGNGSVDEPIEWSPLLPGSNRVTLRAELPGLLDAITCNNAKRRAMMYIISNEEEEHIVEATIQNPVEENIGANQSPVYYASTAPHPFQVQNEDTLYFYIDRSGLDTTDTDDDWNVSFFPSNPEDSLIKIGEDHYKLTFLPGEKKKFKLQFTTPDYASATGETGCPLLDLLCRQYTNKSNISSSSSTKQHRRLLARAGEHKKYFNGKKDKTESRLSNVHIQVYREDKTVVERDSRYRRMEVLGYFGADILVQPKPTDVIHGSLWISLHGGYTKPYEEWYEDAYNYNAILNLELRWRWNWAFVFELGYNDFNWQDYDKHFVWWNISTTARYYFPMMNFKPFLNIGPGLYIPDNGDNRFGAKIGFGFEYAFNNRIVFEGGTDFHYIFPGSKRELYQNKKTTFQHFHAGFVFRLK